MMRMAISGGYVNDGDNAEMFYNIKYHIREKEFWIGLLKSLTFK